MSLWVRPLEFLIASILACSGVLKVVSSLQKDAILGYSDPILPLQTGHLFLAAGLAEILLAVFIAVPRNTRIKLMLITAFSFSVTLYRVGRVAGDAGFLACPCLGHGFSWWPALNAGIPVLSAAFYVALLTANLLLVLSLVLRSLESGLTGHGTPGPMGHGEREPRRIARPAFGAAGDLEMPPSLQAAIRGGNSSPAPGRLKAHR